MAWTHQFSLLVLTAVFFTGTAAEDYFEHPIAVRMQRLDDMLRNNINGSNDRDVAIFIRQELDVNSYLNGGESMIALLKLLATLGTTYPAQLTKGAYPFFGNQNFWILYANSIRKLLFSSSDPALDIEEYRGLAEYVLDWSTFVELLDILGTYRMREALMEWISFVAMLVIENTTHLKNTFSKGMILKLNIMRNQANAIDAIRLLKEQNRDECVIRFPFKKIIFDMELFDQNNSRAELLESQIKRTLVEETTEHSLNVRMHYMRKDMQERGVASAYAALIELSTDEFMHYVDEVAYALAINGLSLKHYDVIAKFHSILRRKLKSLTVLNNGSSERIIEFERVQDILSSEDKQEAFFRTIPLTPQSAIKYLDTLTIISRTTQEDAYPLIAEEIKNSFYRITDMILVPVVFNDSKILTEFDKNHIALYEANKRTLRDRPKHLNLKTINSKTEQYTKEALGLLMSIASVNPEESVDVRNQIRVLIRLTFQMNNLRPKSWYMNNKISATLEKIVAIYLNLMKFGGDIFVTDSVLMTEWYRFTINFPKIVSSALNQFVGDSQSVYMKDQSIDADAVHYIHFARIVNFLAAQRRFTDAIDLSRKLLTIEEKIGYADSSPAFIQKHLIREKQLYYTFYNHQMSLTHLVKHHVELYTSLSTWYIEEIKKMYYDVKSMAKHQLLNGIFTNFMSDPNAESNFIDPTGQLRFRVNQLTHSFIREFGLNSIIIGKARQCESIFGPMF